MVPFLASHLLDQACAQWPDGVALDDGTQEMAFAELGERSDRLASALVGHGIARGERVALLLPKSIDAIVCYWGVLKAGAVCVPIDFRSPDQAVEAILDDCDVKLVLGPGHGAAAVPGTEAVTATVDGHLARLPEPAGPLVRPEIIDRDLAYLVYTSGSTGKPKGVMIPHESLTSDYGMEPYGFEPGDRTFVQAAFASSFFLSLVGRSMARGMTVLVAQERVNAFPADILRFLAERKATVTFTMSSALASWGRGLTYASHPDLRIVSFGGEPLARRALETLLENMPHTHFYSAWGATETPGCWLTTEIPRPLGDFDTTGLLGRPPRDCETMLVRDDGSLAGPGEEGELLIRSSAVMLGYWGDPLRTAEVLVPNPFTGVAHDLAYRTGDIATCDSEGIYRIMGRRDDRVKTRGAAVSLSEVQATILAHPSVAECVVVAVPDEEITNRIVAHVASEGELSAIELSRWCTSRLERHKLPASFVFHDTLPRTASGKLARLGPADAPG